MDTSQQIYDRCHKIAREEYPDDMLGEKCVELGAMKQEVSRLLEAIAERDAKIEELDRELAMCDLAMTNAN